MDDDDDDDDNTKRSSDLSQNGFRSGSFVLYPACGDLMLIIFHILVTILTKIAVSTIFLFSSAATVFSLNMSHANCTFCFSKLVGYKAAYDSFVYLIIELHSSW